MSFLIRPRGSNEDAQQTTTEQPLDPFEAVRTPLSRAATSAMPGLERLHDGSKITSDARIEPGHELLFPDGCDFEIWSFYDSSFGARRGTGAWSVRVRMPGQTNFTKLGSFKTVPLNQTGILIDDIRERGFGDGRDIVARMITTRGGDVMPDVSEDVAEREAQVAAILTFVGEQLAAEADLARAAAAGETALHAA